MSIKYIAVAVIVSLVIARLLSKSRQAAFGNLGFVAGLALGLSASPVLAATITAVFTLVGVITPLYLRSPRDAGDAEEGQLPDGRSWLGPLAIWLAVGLIVGVFLRANDALNFSSDLRSRYQTQGFNKAEIDTIMSGIVTTLAKAPLEVDNQQRKTNLQAQERAEKWAKLLDDLVRADDSPEANLERVKKSVARDDLEHIRLLEARRMSASQVLDALKTWH